MSDLKPARARPAAEGLATGAKSASDYARGAKAENTRRAYRADWHSFAGWCEANSGNALPALPETVAVYVAHLADTGHKVSTIERALVAISQAHKAAGEPSPRGSLVVQEVMKGIRRKLGVAPRKKAPLLAEHLRTIVAALPSSTHGARDRALLLLGFVCGMRRSELAALEVEDVTNAPEGMIVTLRRSKTDQEGQGRKIGVPFGRSDATCPVRALRTWLELAKVDKGPLFRAVNRWGVIGGALDGAEVARVVKRSAKLAGLDPALLSGHSLRAGFVTTAAKSGKSERAIMAQTGHKSERIMRGYYRDANLFTENAADDIGL